MHQDSNCPKCGHALGGDVTECPACGVIVAKAKPFLPVPYFDPERVLPDIDLAACEAKVRLRISLGGDCTAALVTCYPVLQSATTPGVIRDMIGLECFPAVSPPEHLIPLGFQRASRLLNALGTWVNRPSASLQHLLNLEPHGFVLRGAADTDNLMLELTDARESPRDNVFLLHIQKSAAEAWWQEAVLVLEQLPANRTTGG